MKIKNSTAYATLLKKEGSTYANVIVTVLTDSGQIRELEIDIPTPVEEWDNANFDKSIVEKFKVEKTHTNISVDGPQNKTIFN